MKNLIPFILLAVADCLLAGSIIFQGISRYTISAAFWFVLAHAGIAVLMAYQHWKNRSELRREDCPHFNVDGKGQCNLLPEPEECPGYCRTLSVWRRE